MSHCRVLPPGEFNGMSSQSHVSHCRVLPLGEFTVTIPEPRAILQGVRIPSAILKIVFAIFFCFLCSLGFDERWLSYRLRYTCLLSPLRENSESSHHETFRIYGQWLWVHVVKFARWQHSAVGGGQDLLCLAPFLSFYDCFICNFIYVKCLLRILSYRT